MRNFIAFWIGFSIIFIDYFYRSKPFWWINSLTAEGVSWTALFNSRKYNTWHSQDAGDYDVLGIISDYSCTLCTTEAIRYFVAAYKADESNVIVVGEVFPTADFFPVFTEVFLSSQNFHFWVCSYPFMIKLFRKKCCCFIYQVRSQSAQFLFSLCSTVLTFLGKWQLPTSQSNKEKQQHQKPQSEVQMDLIYIQNTRVLA